MPPTQPKTILRMNDVLTLTGIRSRTTIWRRLRDGAFPNPIDLGGGQIGWLENEINEWINSRPRRSYLRRGEA